MPTDSDVPSIKMLHETLLENISSMNLLAKTGENNVASIINVLHNHSFDNDNKQLEKALDSLIEDILSSLK